MKIYIDFSIFDPEGAYGNVTGEIEVFAPPAIGDEVVLVNRESMCSGLKFPGHLRLDAITPAQGYGPEYAVYALADAEMTSRDDARRLGNWLETECGLFCVAYHDKE